MKRQDFEVRTESGDLIGVKHAWNSAKRLGESWIRETMEGKSAACVDSDLARNPETGKPLFTTGAFTWQDDSGNPMTFTINQV